jgi:hypothetical protein
MSIPSCSEPPPTTQLVPVPPAVARPTAAIFGGLSRLRGRRAMHPTGLLLSGQLSVPSDPRLPADWRSLDGAHGLVRFSKAIGLPGGIPDVLGIALRFGDQDILLATALAPAPVLQHILVPARSFDRATFSSLLAHRAGSGIGILRGRIQGTLPAAGGQLEAVRAAHGLHVQLEVGGLLGGRRPLGTVTLGGVLEDQPAPSVRFDPWRAGAGLGPVGPIQRLRAAAYAASRRAVSR